MENVAAHEARAEAIRLLSEKRRPLLDSDVVAWGILQRAGARLEAEAREELTGPHVSARGGTRTALDEFAPEGAR